MATYKDHPYSSQLVIPMMTQPELREMAEDIRRNGQLMPIVLFEGKILDGRNRYRACKLADVEPKFRQLNGEDPLSFILSANVNRRHLTEGQKALIAARAATMERGRPKVSSPRAGSESTATPKKTTVADAARAAGVSPGTVERAKQVLRDAPAAEVEAIERGEKTVGEVARAVKDKKQAAAEVLDKTGHPIPASILPDWRHAETFRPLLSDISRVKVAVERGLADEDLAFREVSNTLIGELGSVYAQLKQLLPHAVCPTCQGHARERCLLCKRRGYLSEFAWRQYVPEETKEIRRRAGA